MSPFWLQTSRSPFPRPQRFPAPVVAGLLLLALMAGCSQNRRPNILLVSIDSLRADHVHSYGYERETSPTMDRLAAEGALFRTALAPSSWTLPSHMTLLTGIPPHHHGVNLDGKQLAPDVDTLAEVLSRAGYRTSAIVAGPYVSARYGFDQGFDEYDESNIAPATEIHTRLTSPALVDSAKAWIGGWRKEDTGEPFFLFLHMWDVHYDFNPPAPYDRLFDPDYDGPADGRNFEKSEAVNPDMDPRDLEFVISLYDGEIRFTDHHLGRLVDHLAEIGELDNTIIVVTADHGEEFFEHGHKGHRRTLYDEVLLVPLIIRYPDRITPGTVVEKQARLMDVGSKILSLAGVEQPATYALTSDYRHLEPKDPSCGIDHPECPLQNIHFGDFEDYLLTVRTQDTKLLMSPKGFFPPRLFDLTTDPAEMHDIAADWPGKTAVLLDAAQRFQAGDQQVRDQPAKIDQEQLDRLKSLGYVN